LTLILLNIIPHNIQVNFLNFLNLKYNNARYEQYEQCITLIIESKQ